MTDQNPSERPQEPGGFVFQEVKRAMIITKSRIEWNLTFRGEPMQSPVFESYEQCVQYIALSSDAQRKDFRIISRIVVTQTGDWFEWAF